MEKIEEIFNEPKIIGLIGDVNSGKSLTIYWIIKKLEKIGKFKLYTYGLKYKLDEAQVINSIEELEQIRNSIIVLDEVMSLWNLDDRMAKRKIENSLRLINHNNNILVICGLPENIKKFLSGKINTYILKKCTISDFINGSKSKYVVTNYHGDERGSSVLNLQKNEALIFDGFHYNKINIPYISIYDNKKNNPKIIKEFVKEFVNESVNEKIKKEVSLDNCNKNLKVKDTIK